MYSSQALSQLVVSSCRAMEIQHIVISPGSRNAPLMIGFAHDDYFHRYSIVDERCAAFFALGMAQQTGTAIALVCTSGSALLNYYPAISEAYYSNIPLVVISADRPADKIDIGDGQAIRQPHVFANHICAEANLSEQKSIAENQQILQIALQKNTETQQPIHINVPFEEPLYNLTSTSVISNIEIKTSELPYNIDHKQQMLFKQRWEQSSKKILLVGQMSPQQIDEELLAFFANNPSLIILCESLSNIHHPVFIDQIDKLVVRIEDSETLLNSLQPEMLISIGGMIISKKIKKLLRQRPAKWHYHIGSHQGYDTYGYLTEHFKMPETAFFHQTKLQPKQESNYQSQWLYCQKVIQQCHQEFVNNIPFSDLQIFDFLSTHIPDDLNIHISNSSTIRYHQLFEKNSRHQYQCNRGVSGIDGSTSTAIGGAIHSTTPTLLITGDISFLYDSNGLWNAHTPANFKIIIINNSGGGIFRILQPKVVPSYVTQFLETPHQLDASHLAKMYQYGYLSARDMDELSETVPKFFEEQRPMILEIFTPREQNDTVLKEYMQYLRETVID